jgi:predicted RNase H-like HicB family nuclease
VVDSSRIKIDMESNSKKIYNYTVILEKEEDGGYHAFCPVLKGCHSQGDTFEDAIENITEAIGLYIESLIADNQPIPREDLIVKPLSILV